MAGRGDQGMGSNAQRLEAARERYAAEEAKLQELQEIELEATMMKDAALAAEVQGEVDKVKQSLDRLRVGLQKLEKQAKLEAKIAAKAGGGGVAPAAASHAQAAPAAQQTPAQEEYAAEEAKLGELREIQQAAVAEEDFNLAAEVKTQIELTLQNLDRLRVMVQREPAASPEPQAQMGSNAVRLAAAQERYATEEAKLRELQEIQQAAVAEQDFALAAEVKAQVESTQKTLDRLRVGVQKLEKQAKIEAKIAARGSGGGAGRVANTAMQVPVQQAPAPVVDERAAKVQATMKALLEKREEVANHLQFAAAVEDFKTAARLKEEIAGVDTDIGRLRAAAEQAGIPLDGAPVASAPAMTQAAAPVAPTPQRTSTPKSPASPARAKRSNSNRGQAVMTPEQIRKLREEDYTKKRTALENARQRFAADPSKAGEVDVLNKRIEILEREFSDLTGVSSSSAGSRTVSPTMPKATVQAAQKQSLLSRSGSSSSNIAAAAGIPRSKTVVTAQGAVRTGVAAKDNLSAKEAAYLDRLTPEQRALLEKLEMTPSPGPKPKLTTRQPAITGNLRPSPRLGAPKAFMTNPNLNPAPKQAVVKLTEAELELLQPEIRREYDLALRGLGPMPPSIVRQQFATASSASPNTTSAQSLRSSTISGSSTMGVAAPKAGIGGGSSATDDRLVKAARFGKVDAIRELLDSGSVGIDSADFQTGHSALMAAVEKNFRDVVELLVARGAKLDHRDRRGQTALHLSITKRHDQMTIFLLERGADILLQDNVGNTPYDCAQKAPLYAATLDSYRTAARVARAEAEKAESNAIGDVSEIITFFVGKGSRQDTFKITATTTAATVLRDFAQRRKVEDLLQDLEIGQLLMGRETAINLDDCPLLLKRKWPNQNPVYCKFTIKLKRGTDMAKQMRFRDATGKHLV